jgi:hypothetical protein
MLLSASEFIISIHFVGSGPTPIQQTHMMMKGKGFVCIDMGTSEIINRGEIKE